MLTHRSATTSDLATSHRYSAAALATVVGLGLLFGTYSAADRNTQLSIGRNEAEQLAAHSALLATGTLDTARQLLRAMAILADPPNRSGNTAPDAIQQRLRALQAGFPPAMDLLIVAADGHIRHWTGSGEAPDISAREYFTHHVRRANSPLFVGQPQLSKVHSGRWFFALSEALRDNQGGLSQVLVVIVDVAALRDLLSVPLAIPGSTQALLAENGMVYARLPDHSLHVGKQISRPQELDPLTPATPSATIVSHSQLDQRERILSFRRLANYPVTAVGTVVVDELLAEWRHRSQLLAALWTALSIGILWITRRENRISRTQQELANLDALTGVRNRRSILSSASTLERSQQHAGSLSLLMVDIDHFKAVNDRFGHLVGDEVLR